MFYYSREVEYLELNFSAKKHLTLYIKKHFYGH